MPLSDEQARKIVDSFDKKLDKLESGQIKLFVKSLKASETRILAELARLGAEMERDQAYMDERGRALYRVRVDRLEGLLGQINSFIDEFGRELIGGQSAWLQTTLNLSDEYAGKMLQTRLAATFSALDTNALTYIQKYNFDLLTKVTTNFKAEVGRILTEGFSEGASVAEMTRTLVNTTELQRGVFSSVEERGEVIIRTETIRAFSQGAKAQFSAYGVRIVRWMTARDDRVCKFCAPLDGLTFPLEDTPKKGPPVHPRCRCFIRPVIINEEEQAAPMIAEAQRNAKEQNKRLSTRKKKRRRR